MTQSNYPNHTKSKSINRAGKIDDNKHIDIAIRTPSQSAVSLHTHENKIIPIANSCAAPRKWHGSNIVMLVSNKTERDVSKLIGNIKRNKAYYGQLIFRDDFVGS